MSRGLRVIFVAVAGTVFLCGSRAAGLEDGSPELGSTSTCRYVEMKISTTALYGTIKKVILVDNQGTVHLAVPVTSAESTTVEFRAVGQKFAQPQTHDILETIMRNLGGHLVRAQLDSLRDGTLSASLHFERDGQRFKVETRASDALILAAGGRARIFVANEIVKVAGLPGDPSRPPISQAKMEGRLLEER